MLIQLIGIHDFIVIDQYPNKMVGLELENQQEVFCTLLWKITLQLADDMGETVENY